MMDDLIALDAFWTVENKYDLFRMKYVYHVHIFDGEPCIANGVGEVSGFREVKTKADLLTQAIGEAVSLWKVGRFDEAIT